MIRNYLTIAWRVITRNRLYTAINILGLALGICGCIVIWLVAAYELSFDKFHPDGDRIYRLGHKVRDGFEVETPPPTAAAIRSEIPGIETVVPYFTFYDTSTAIVAGPEYFTLFKFDWLAGTPLTALRDPFSVVISESKAKQYFGAIDPAKILGKQLIFEDSLKVHVTGIIRDWPQHTDIPCKELISWSTVPVSFLRLRMHPDDWGLRHGYPIWTHVFLKLAPHTSPKTVDTQLAALAARHIGPWMLGPFDIHLQPLKDIHFDPDYRDQLHHAHLPTLYGVMGIAGFILLLAIINFVNLATAQSLQRAKEIGIRKVLGSARGHLMTQFLLETALITTLAATLATLLVRPVLYFFGDYIPDGVRFQPLQPATLLFLIGTTIGATLLAGFYPARVIAAYRPVSSLKDGATQRGGEKWWLRKSLVVFQFTISLAFIIVALVMGDQIHYMLDTDYGVRTDAVLTIYPDNRDSAGMAKARVFAEELRHLPGVGQVIWEGGSPVANGAWGTGVTYKGKEEMKIPVAALYYNADGLPFYQIKLLAGRNILHSDSSSEFLINQTLATSLGFRTPADALGKPLYFTNRPKPLPIVGVMADVQTGSMREAIRPTILVHDPSAERELGIRLNSKGRGAAAIGATLASMQNLYKKLYPQGEFDARFMDETIALLYEDEQKTSSLVRAATAVAIFISCMGLFGLALFMTERKAREIGIRKVLGATVPGIVTQFTKQFATLVLLALLIASPLAWWFAHHWLQDFTFRVPVHVHLFALAGAGALLIALATVGAQCIRAARANPVKHLRSE